MIEEAFLWIVLVCQLAWLSLEVEEVYEGHRIVILSDLLSAEIATCVIQLIVATTHGCWADSCRRLNRIRWSHFRFLWRLRGATRSLIEWGGSTQLMLLIQQGAMLNPFIFALMWCGTARPFKKLWIRNFPPCFNLFRIYSWVFLCIERLRCKNPLLSILWRCNLARHLLQLYKMSGICIFGALCATPSRVLPATWAVIYFGYWQKTDIIGYQWLVPKFLLRVRIRAEGWRVKATWLLEH